MLEIAEEAERRTFLRGAQATLLTQPPFRLSAAATAALSEAASQAATARELTNLGGDLARSSSHPLSVTHTVAELAAQPIECKSLRATCGGATACEKGPLGDVELRASAQACWRRFKAKSPLQIVSHQASTTLAV